MITPKQNLILEMEYLNKQVCKYLVKLSTEEIDEFAWMEINSGCHAVQMALRHYFGEDVYNSDNCKITILTPDDRLE